MKAICLLFRLDIFLFLNGFVRIYRYVANSKIKSCNIWICVSGVPGDEPDNIAEWHLNVKHDPGFVIAQWFKRKLGKKLASELFGKIKLILSGSGLGNIENADDA